MGRLNRKKTRNHQRYFADWLFRAVFGRSRDGENVKLFFPLTDGRTIQFWGEVSNHVFEIGFAVKFIEMSDAQKEFLEVFVDTFRTD